ncbi:MAG: cytochrome c [Gammaproteobacteria bacterium]|jgi:mono/diheme cytochrome c family protein|nr:cytochrome c [Gammaproteobacteria bacterium]
MRLLNSLTIVVVTTLVALLTVISSGFIDPGADQPHSRPLSWLLEVARRRGVEMRARTIEVPVLDSTALVRAGAGNYDAMCVDCHLRPEMADSELRRGLYPHPPVLADMMQATPPAQAFWIIKHGIKASGMPAWGQSMDDEAIWGMVAFLQRLPGMTARGYQQLVTESAGHSHRGAPGLAGQGGPAEADEKIGETAEHHDTDRMHEHAEGHDHDESGKLPDADRRRSTGTE